MVSNNSNKCPKCNTKLKHRYWTKRICKVAGGIKQWLPVEVMICSVCKKTHRKLPNNLVPYKHYNKEIIVGVLNNAITTYVLDYEDYPCDQTMLRWKSQNLHILL